VRFAPSREAIRLDIVTGESAPTDRELDALRRVATLVAQEASPQDLFDAVAEEVGRLLPVGTTTMGRFEPDDCVTTVASWSATEVAFPTGGRWPIEGTNVAWMVFQTGRAARLDDFSGATDPIGVAAREAGYTSAVGSPIVVKGHLWGVVTATSSQGQLPPGTEARLASFTELVATAIAHAEARGALERVAEEQAALRRVATLVAEAAPAGEIFRAVSEEVARLFGDGLAGVGRFDLDGKAVTLVGLAPPSLEGFEIGTRMYITDGMPAARVRATGRSARVDRADLEAVSVFARRHSIVSSVSSPIIVEGKLWGATTAMSTTKLLPPDTERRLERFSELVATAIANAENRSELAASRRRIVAASDQARHRIERDLHDGTQQRLVALALAVRAVEADAPPDLTSLRSELSRIAAGLVDATAELQEISRGIHPGNLAQSGLGPALRTLARRSPVPVDLEITIEGRLPEAIEVAAYYVTSEALANTAKHAQASRGEVSMTARDNAIVLSIRDDGVGGADLSRGSGLVGLTDRVQALGGTVDVQSVVGRGTCITTILPLDVEAIDDRAEGR